MIKNSIKSIHKDLQTSLKRVYEPRNLFMTKFVAEKESQEYGASQFEIKNLKILFRIAKITPKKIGLFVTLWKRIELGPILPYDLIDPIDLFIISVRSSKSFGQFIFPKSILQEKGIVSKDGKGGKRALRVYPPWDNPDSKQAKKTQTWQLPYFFKIDSNNSLEFSRLEHLFH